MKSKILSAALIAAFVSLAAAQEKKEVKPNPVKATFYISGMQCSRCVDAIEASVKKVPSVTAVNVSEAGGYAQVSFDTHTSSYHQIAQAIADAEPQHGDKYAATLKLKAPDYAKADNAAKIDAIFAKEKQFVRVEAVNKNKGEFTLHFLPLKVDAAKKAPQGWNAGKFGHPIHDEAPKGLGLPFQIVKEGGK
jgi:copper chaperone CopZ